MERQNDICQLRKKVHTTHWVLKVGRTSSSVYEKAERKTKMELEGMQIDAKKVYVCVTPADADGNGSKFPQAIMSLDRK